MERRLIPTTKEQRVCSGVRVVLVWAGLHFRTADEHGRQLGENVAAYMTDHYFQPVGEP